MNKKIKKFYKKIGENVKKKRLEKGYSQLDLALEIDINPQFFIQTAKI